MILFLSTRGDEHLTSTEMTVALLFRVEDVILDGTQRVMRWTGRMPNVTVCIAGLEHCAMQSEPGFIRMRPAARRKIQ